MSSSKHIKAKKGKIIQDRQIHKTDVGSPEVQIAIFTEKIKKLADHLKKNKKDNSSRRGLLKMIGQRKKLLSYLLGESVNRYLNVCKKNAIRASLVVVKGNVAPVAVAETEVDSDEE